MFGISSLIIGLRFGHVQCGGISRIGKATFNDSLTRNAYHR